MPSLTPLPIKDYSKGRGIGGYPFHAMRPNMAYNNHNSDIGLLFPQRPYCHKYKFSFIHPTPYNIVVWQDRAMFFRWYRSKARTNARHPVKSRKYS